MKISIYGSGYVGLVTAICLADSGHDVICMDVDAQKISRLQQGISPIYEPGLERLLRSNMCLKRLSFTNDAALAAQHGILQFIAVGTPPDEDGSADLRYVNAVASSIARFMDGYRVIVNKSTVPVGTAEIVSTTVTKGLRRRKSNLEFDVCSNPEFLKEGSAIQDFTEGERIVIGTGSNRVRELMQECYAQFHSKLLFMSVRAAELTKYAANAMLATRISFMNELSLIAEAARVDIEDVRLGIGSDPRIGSAFLRAGCGYGGSCFPKDVRALIRTAEHLNCSGRILKAVEETNHAQKNLLFKAVTSQLGSDLSGLTIAVWGLAFKPGTDDMREASSRNLMEAVWQAGGRIKAYDPQAMHECRRLYSDQALLSLAESPEGALCGADLLVICTEWPEFKSLDTALFRQKLLQPIVIDGRNMFEPEEMEKLGIQYHGIGRGRPLNTAFRQKTENPYFNTSDSQLRLLS